MKFYEYQISLLETNIETCLKKTAKNPKSYNDIGLLSKYITLMFYLWIYVSTNSGYLNAVEINEKMLDWLVDSAFQMWTNDTSMHLS